MTRAAATKSAFPLPKRVWVILVCAALISGIIVAYLSNLYRSVLMEQIQRDTSHEMTAKIATLATVIDSKLQRTNGLRAFAIDELTHSGYIDPSKFYTFASNFIAMTVGIRNLSIYPEGIAEFIYPTEGNEQLKNINVFEHPNPLVRENAELTKKTTSITVMGPQELTQSGIGIISRQAIFQDEQFWGFVSVVLDIDPILQEANFYSAETGIEFAVRANSLSLFGDSSLFNKDAIVKTINIKEGIWEMAAVPTDEKLKPLQSSMLIFNTIGTGAIMLLIYFVYIQLTQQVRLQQQVAERTQHVENANRKLAQTLEQLTIAAYQDVTTGLHNRTYFNDILEQKIQESSQKRTSLALLFIDLDQFKILNDTCGHYYGDMLLKEVGRRLTRLAISDADICRIGGDEFTILISNIVNIEQAKLYTQQVCDLFLEPFEIKGAMYYVTASIGVAIFPLHAPNSSMLIRHADQAMYRAKDEGKNQYCIYDNSLSLSDEHTLEMKNGLIAALARDELSVHYQPLIELKSRKIIGLEALARWNHPTRGIISPSVFIPVAEESGLIALISEKVLQTVCAQIKAWQLAGIPPIRIAVNLSTKQFASQNLPDRIEKIVASYQLDPAYIELEITESMIMRDDMQPALYALRDKGFAISIDDFGTQYSSLNYLKILPVNKIKIDRTFVNGITRDRKDEAIIVAILLIASRLNLTVIAEGVETNEQLAFLLDNNCHEAQGFIFYKPMPADQITELLRGIV